MYVSDQVSKLVNKLEIKANKEGARRKLEGNLRGNLDQIDINVFSQIVESANCCMNEEEDFFRSTISKVAGKYK